MQLSSQSSERQLKDILKCSLGFEHLLIVRKAISRDQNDTEILAELIAKYNSFKANAAHQKLADITARTRNRKMENASTNIEWAKFSKFSFTALQKQGLSSENA